MIKKRARRKESKKKEKIDPRILRIAKLLLEYSCKVKKRDVVQVLADMPAKPLALELEKQILLKGAYPIIHWQVDKQAFIYYKYASKEQLKKFPKISMYEMQNTDAIIIIHSPKDKKELANIKAEKISLKQKATRLITNERLKKRWVVFCYPNAAFAKDAGMSLRKFKNFVFSACLIDWKKFSSRLRKATSLINKGKQVRILGKDTDLSFSIAGRKAIVGDGTFNMPDGEIFTAPKEETVDGHIYFNFPRYIFGKEVSGIYLEFKKGKLVKVKAKKNLDKLKALLATDKGSSRIGEFAFGMNPKIKRYIHELLFDEKIDKTIHLALGNAYKECKGKNKSAIHLDIVKDMKKGKVFMDNRLIYKNGKFI